MKPTKKPLSSRLKIVPKPARAKKSPQGEASGPDETRPDTKADEIYGDTKIPPSHRKYAFIELVWKKEREDEPNGDR